MTSKSEEQPDENDSSPKCAISEYWKGDDLKDLISINISLPSFEESDSHHILTHEAILSYNSRFKSVWDMEVLHYLCENDLIPDGGSAVFFNHTLPAMCELALKLPEYFIRPIPLMLAGHDSSITLSQLQIASLLANAFFCTFYKYPNRRKNQPPSKFPGINFFSLLSSMSREITRKSNKMQVRNLNRKYQKLRCILHYFHRVINEPPQGYVTFTRRNLSKQAPNWSFSERLFAELRLHVSATKHIEDAGPNTLQVDFANKFIGGGVLRSGCVQEEIMFVLKPELLVALLFAESLRPDEAFIIEGAEQYSTSKGYAETFEWTGDFQQSETNLQRDSWGRWNYAVVAIDAVHYRDPQRQFTQACMLRDVNKAYCGFTDKLAPERKLPPVVASGNWGCGAYKGNVELKAILQMMACIEANKALAYYTFGDEELCDRIYNFHAILSEHHVTVGEMWKFLVDKFNLNPPESGSVFEIIKEGLIKTRISSSS